MQMASSGGLLNSLVGKTLGDDEIDNFIDIYARNISKMVQRHKALRQTATGRGSHIIDQ